MKYFICEICKVQLGIPANSVERIIQVAAGQEAEAEDAQAYVSLPALFKLEGADAPHGIVIKTTGAIKTVLLTPKIDIDLEIPDEAIHALPIAFSGFYRYFSGLCFDRQNLILILEPEKLTEGPG
jgi:hypothetical protein